jgi:hypothetical protein
MPKTMKKTSQSLVLFACLGIWPWVHAAQSENAQRATVERYFEVTQYRDFLQRQSLVKDNYYRALAQQQVMYHLKNFELQPEQFNSQQQKVVNELVNLYKQSDPDYRSPEQEYQFQIKRYQKYFSEDSLQYFIQHSQTDAEKELIIKNNINMLYQSMVAPTLLTDYLDVVDFSQTVFKDILKLDQSAGN